MSPTIRHRALAAAAITLAAIAVPAAAKPDKPPKPPKPKVELLTSNEEGAVAKKAIKVLVSAKRGAEVVAEGRVVVEGYPEDFPFALATERKPLKRGQATIRFPLSARKVELIAFAADTCRGTSVTIEAEVKKRVGRFSGGLSLPSDC